MYKMKSWASDRQLVPRCWKNFARHEAHARIRERILNDQELGSEGLGARRGGSRDIQTTGMNSRPPGREEQPNEPVPRREPAC
jgi:hypothetical protein